MIKHKFLQWCFMPFHLLSIIATAKFQAAGNVGEAQLQGLYFNCGLTSFERKTRQAIPRLTSSPHPSHRRSPWSLPALGDLRAVLPGRSGQLRREGED